MGLKSYRPITPTLRYKQIGDRKEITAQKPYKPLTEGIKRSSGRNNAGEITSRRRGGVTRNCIVSLTSSVSLLVSPALSKRLNTIRTVPLASLSSSTKTASAHTSSLRPKSRLAMC